MAQGLWVLLLLNCVCAAWAIMHTAQVASGVITSSVRALLKSVNVQSLEELNSQVDKLTADINK